MFTVRYFSNEGYWGCIQSNLLDGMLRNKSNPTLFPAYTYGLFICDTIHLVEVSHINKSCILGLSRGKLRISFISISWVMVHDRYYYSGFLFVYFFLGFSLFDTFLTTKMIYAVRENWFAILILIKI